MRQQRRRDLNEIEPAPHASRREAGQVSDHAATERNDEIISLDRAIDDRFTDFLKCRVVFRTFSRRHDNTCTINAGRLERGLDSA